MSDQEATTERDWRYFAEALAWYDGQNLTGGQVFGVIEQVRQALRDGRITPDDLGLVKYDRAVLVDVLVYHWRRNDSGCGCGWADLGRSWPEHVATVYEESVRAHT